MAGSLPPPPTRAPDGSFAWLDWYNKLRDFLSTAGTIAWALVDKAGSQLSDLQVRDHVMLTNVQGGAPTEQYHLTLAQWTAIGTGQHNSLSGLQGGVAGQYYHLTAAEYAGVTGTKSNVITGSASAQSIPNNVFTTVTNWTTTLNTGSNFNSTTGVYTVPVAGTYDIHAALSFTSAAFTQGQVVAIGLFVNGVLQQQVTTIVQTTANLGHRVAGSFRVNCAATNTITLQAFQNQGGAVTLDGATTRNFLTIRQD